MPLRRRRTRGFTLIELIIVVALAGIILLIAAPFFYRTWRRQRMVTSVREIYSLALATRMQAVKRNTHIIMQVDLPNRRIVTWADTLNPAYNYVQDPTEPTINLQSIPIHLFFSFAPTGSVDDAQAVSFDTYISNGALVDLIVFQGDGTIVPPEAANSQQPLKVLPVDITATVPVGSINCNPGNQCRGIYIADNDMTGDVANRNVFRISVDDFGSTGRVSLLKWIPTSEGGNGGQVNYVPLPWKWVY